MTKKDYIAIAEDIKGNTLPGHGEDLLLRVPTFVKSLMLTMAQDNPRFDRARFWAACGLKAEDL